MASKNYLDKRGLEYAWGKIKTYLDTELDVNLIEKRVVTTSGAVSIPAGTRAIAYVGIGGGGGGGGGGWFTGGGGGGGGATGDATGGAGGAGNGTPDGVGGTGGAGGAGEIGFLYSFEGLSISAVIGAGGAGGATGGAGGATGGAGKAGGKSYVNVTGSSIIPALFFPDKTTLNRNGNGGGTSTSNDAPGAGGVALTVLGTSAGAGGGGGRNAQSGSAGQKGAIIFFFYS